MDGGGGGGGAERLSDGCEVGGDGCEGGGGGAERRDGCEGGGGGRVGAALAGNFHGNLLDNGAITLHTLF